MQSKSPIHTPAGLKEHLFATSTASEVQLEQNLRRHSQKAKAERERQSKSYCHYTAKLPALCTHRLQNSDCIVNPKPG